MSKFDNYNLNTEYKQRELDMLPQTGTTKAHSVGDIGNSITGELISREAAIAAVVLYGENCMGAERALRALPASTPPVQGPIAASPCRCRSYNRPDLGGDVGEIVVTMPAHLRDRLGRSEEATTVCLDLCIAPLVLAMWAAGIPTLGSCCGHNNPEWHRDVIVHPEDRAAAAAVVIGLNDNARIGAWEGDTLVWSEATHPDTQEIERLRDHADLGWALYTHWNARYLDCARDRDRIEGRLADVEAERDDLAKSLHAEMGARDDALVRAEKAEAERDAALAQVAGAYEAAAQIAAPHITMGWVQEKTLSAILSGTPADASAAVERMIADRVQEDREARSVTVKPLVDALTPSDKTKAAYIGEFSFNIVDRDEDGEECYRRVLVPWDTIKEIMKSIRDLAALTTAQSGEGGV